jgi:hypothetical protein
MQKATCSPWWLGWPIASCLGAHASPPPTLGKLQ